MIKKLKKKIALINLMLAGIILLTALLVVFVVGSTRIQKDSERLMMSVLTEKITPQEIQTNEEFRDLTLIVIDNNTNQVSIFASEHVRFDEQLLKELVPQILANKENEGFVMRMRCKYIKMDTPQNVTRIVILDGFARSSNYGSYFAISALLVCVSLACFFVISTILANIALKPVEESWKKQTQFVADASHELKTPLSIISANTDVVTSHPDETVESQMKWIEATRSETKRMNELVSNLLFLTKNDSGLTVNMEKVNFSDCVGTTALSCDAIFYEKGKTFSYDVPLNINVYGNKQQLQQLTTILLDNANKYSTGAGNIHLQLQATERYAQLTISNDSNPLTAEQLSRMFDRFYTLDSSHNKQLSGNGLGLAIAKSICEMHKGKIKVDYDNGRTTFTATIPLFDSKKVKRQIIKNK